MVTWRSFLFHSLNWRCTLLEFFVFFPLFFSLLLFVNRGHCGCSVYDTTIVPITIIMYNTDEKKRNKKEIRFLTQTTMRHVVYFYFLFNMPTALTLHSTKATHRTYIGGGLLFLPFHFSINP